MNKVLEILFKSNYILCQSHKTYKY